MDNMIPWLIGVLVCAIIVITVVIPTTTNVSNTVATIGTNTGELFAGTAATPHTTVKYPIVAVTAFKTAFVTVGTNTTTIVNSTGTGIIPIDSFAANDGSSWNAVNVTFNYTTANSTDNFTWIAGTCNPTNLTFATSTTATTSSINSTCLTPGGNLVFTFVNNTHGTDKPVNITGESISYFKYADNSSYTVSLSTGQITPTYTGYDYASYSYGSGITTNTFSLILLLPLLIAVVLFMAFLKSSGYF